MGPDAPPTRRGTFKGRGMLADCNVPTHERIVRRNQRTNAFAAASSDTAMRPLELLRVVNEYL